MSGQARPRCGKTAVKLYRCQWCVFIGREYVIFEVFMSPKKVDPYKVRQEHAQRKGLFFKMQIPHSFKYLQYI